MTSGQAHAGVFLDAGLLQHGYLRAATGGGAGVTGGVCGSGRNFIHVEIYDNPHEIQGDLRNAKRAAAVTEWGLPNEPWTFVVGGDGKVADKFEAFVGREELEEALVGVGVH